MQMLRGMGVKVIEIPTDPKQASALKRWNWRWNSGRLKAHSGAKL